jgi:hypothetical protein
MVLPIPLAVAAAAAVAVEVASTMVIGLPGTAYSSQSKTRVSDVAVNLGSCVKGDSPFYLRACVTGATTINV